MTEFLPDDAPIVLHSVTLRRLDNGALRVEAKGFEWSDGVSAPVTAVAAYADKREVMAAVATMLDALATRDAARYGDDMERPWA